MLTKFGDHEKQGTGLSAILLAAALFSCSGEFLHKEPQGTTAETVFTNEKGIEARFLRAFYNLEAWLVFGNIPLITEDTPDPAKVSNVNPEGAVLEHIIGDLKFAAANLPETQADVGRPTRYAARALAAKAYLQELMYAEAKPLLDAVINSGRYWIRDQDFGGPYLPASKPFYEQHERPRWGTIWMPASNSNNYRYLRLGHVLLWRAEVAAWEGDLTRAHLYVNMVRERAGNEVVMGRVQIHELPPGVYPWGPGTSRRDHLTGGSVDWNVPAANYRVGLYDEPFGTRAEAMRAVQWELRLEFATEGHRFFDLRRWDNLPPELNSMPMEETLNSFAQADTRIRSFMSGAVFIPERDKYQPIPQEQIDMQPGVLVQNPAY